MVVSSSSDGKLPTGGIVGIVLAILVALFISSMGLLFLYRRSSTRSSTSACEDLQLASAERAGSAPVTSLLAGRSTRFRPPPPIFIPSNSLSVAVPVALRSAGSDVSSLQVVSLEEGTSGLDEEEILCEGFAAQETLAPGRRSISKASVPKELRGENEEYNNVQSPVITSIASRDTPSGGSFTANLRSSNTRDSSSPFRPSSDFVSPSNESRKASEEQIWSGAEEAVASLTPAPRRKASRASVTSAVESSSALTIPRRMDGAGTSDLPVVSTSTGKNRPVSEQLAAYVTETFSERLSQENFGSPGLRRRRSGLSTNESSSNSGSKCQLSPSLTQGLEPATAWLSGQIINSPHSTSLKVPSSDVSPQGSITLPYPPEVYQGSSSRPLKRRSRSQPRLSTREAALVNRSKRSLSPLPSQEGRVLKSPTSLSRFRLKERDLQSLSAPTSRRASGQPLAICQDRLPSPIYGRFDPRRSKWSADSEFSLHSGSDSNNSSISNGKFAKAAGRIGQPSILDVPAQNELSPVNRPSSRPTSRESTSSLSLRAQIERANAWSRAFDEEQRRDAHVFSALRSAHLC